MNETNSRIAIIGGSGRAGRPFVEEALGRGFALRALARHPERLPADRAGLEIFQGDARDPAALLALLEGCGRVEATLGTAGERSPASSRPRAT